MAPLERPLAVRSRHRSRSASLSSSDHPLMRRMARRRRLLLVLPLVGVALAAGRVSPVPRSKAGQPPSEAGQHVGPGLVRSGDGLTLTVHDNGKERQVFIRKDKQGWIVEDYPAGVKPATDVTRVEPFAGAPKAPNAPRAPDWRGPSSSP